MAQARRGEVLDFSTIPVDKTRPDFFPKTMKFSKGEAIHPRMQERIESYRNKVILLKQKAEVRKELRTQSYYQEALEQISEEMAGPAHPVICDLQEKLKSRLLSRP